MVTISVAWINRLGEQSRTHDAINLEQALCGQLFPENFHVVPREFGLYCLQCRGLPESRGEDASK